MKQYPSISGDRYRAIPPGGVGIPFGDPENPLSKDNYWRRWIAPRLKEVGLEWVNFQVMRRTHATLMRELKVDPKVVADQLGHSVDVNLNVYSQTALGLRKEAWDTLETALRVT